ncbi:hypothetical protein [Streptomyces sp. NPDC015125]|uniref:hypothetical protein n=1 Tax=Streptomyces sp. NPDC015125 TaxID=3364938 RepID=UPI0036F6D2A4
MRSRQLAFCAAVAACAVMTPPVYGGDARATGTGTVSAAAASAAPAPVISASVILASATSDGTGRTAIPTAVLRGTPAGIPARVPTVTSTGTAQVGTIPEAVAAHPAPALRAASALHPAPAVRPAPAPHTGAPAEASPSRELSSTSAVGLVLAGGAILVIAGQLLRLRMRLRRERRGEADEH